MRTCNVTDDRSQRLKEHEHDHAIADLPGQVLVALDHLTHDEREGVFRAVRAFARRVGSLSCPRHGTALRFTRRARHPGIRA